MLNKLFLTLAVCAASLAYAYEYRAEIELKDGSIHQYMGPTRDGRMIDHWGHDPADIVREDIQILPYWD